MINIVEKRTTVFSRIIIGLEIWVFFIAPIISGASTPSFYYFTGALGILSFFELGFSANPKNLMAATCKLFTVMIIINALTLIVLPNGLFVDDGAVYLFGLRTGFSLFIIPAILFNLVRDKYEGRTSAWTVTTFLFGAFSLIHQMVVTGILELLIIVILLAVLKNKRIAEKINFIWVALGLMVINLTMTVWASQNQTMGWISAAFGKDVTLSGRTEIWTEVIEKLAASPIAGVGGDATVTIGITERPAHNQWLHFAMEGGYVAMILLIVAVIISFAFLYKSKKSNWYSVFSICAIAILVGSITEIQTYVPFFFVVFDLPYLLERWDRQNEMLQRGINV